MLIFLQVLRTLTKELTRCPSLLFFPNFTLYLCHILPKKFLCHNFSLQKVRNVWKLYNKNSEIRIKLGHVRPFKKCRNQFCKGFWFSLMIEFCRSASYGQRHKIQLKIQILRGQDKTFYISSKSCLFFIFRVNTII